MSLPAAAAPVAVLVLAWDEATPAVRALLEAPGAAPSAFDSVVVVVPAGPAAPEDTTQKEPSPLAVAPEPPPSAGALVPEGAATAARDAPKTTPLAKEAAAPTAAAADATPISVASPTPPAPTPPAWAEVRILRLSSFTLPTLGDHLGRALPAPAWTGTPTAPSAPYVGSAAGSFELAQAGGTTVAADSQLVAPADLPAAVPTPPPTPFSAVTTAPAATEAVAPLA